MDEQQLIESEQLSASEITSKTEEIYQTVLRESACVVTGNFRSIHPDDLSRLFELYDESFFAGACRRLLEDSSIEFRLSKRMTSSAGKASRMARRGQDGELMRYEYEIAVSTTLLFQTFLDEERPITMSGIRCRDRLEALQRVLEHEIVHLIEVLVWGDSSCSAHRFQAIANRFFGHTEHRHQLITPTERAFTQFGIKAGDRVSFRLDGRRYVGLVNRITKRATVLVEDRAGRRYSDGKRYTKYYVPITMLKSVAD